jgi:hypothetical protein
MSQRPSASRPASRSPPDGQGITLPPVQLRDDNQPGGRLGERRQSENESRGSFSQHSQQSQPSPQHIHPPPPGSLGEDWRMAAPSRDLGVHSMLNPTEPDHSNAPGHRRLSATESPLSTIGATPHFGNSPSTAPAHSFPGQPMPSTTPPTGEGYPPNFGLKQRRILTPRSPSSRTVSGGRAFGHATIDAQQSPFLPGRGRSYIAEPGPSASSDVPPMPTSTAAAHQQQQQQQQYGFPPTGTPTSSVPPRRASGGNMQAPVRTPLSQSASPSISASSHNPSSSQTSPASFLYHKGPPPPPSSSSYYPGSSFATSMQQQGGGMQLAGPAGSSEGPGPYSAPTPQTQGSSFHSSSASGSRQTSASDPIQVLTITTSQGSYHVPVDVHQASRSADEKRARNAGASARFRQRRKEKEKEASSSIEKLQQQTRELERKVREVEQERDFYRAERDRFRDVVYRTPETRHLAKGPPSPQAVRAGQFPGSMSQIGGPPPPPPPPSMAFQTPGPETGPGGERAPRRRRTDTRGEFTSLPSYSLPPASTLPPVQAGYPPGPTGPVPPSLPPLRIESSTMPPSGGPGASPSTTGPPPPSYGSYARSPFERGWPSEGGR